MKCFAFATTTCGVFALAGLVSVGAQTGQTPSTSPNVQNPPSGNELTVVGCLKSADDATESRSGTAGSTSSTPGTMTGQSSSQSAKYVLTDAEIRSGSASSAHSGMASGTASTSGSTPGATSGTTTKSDDDKFQLIAASSSVSFAEHLNHQVEVRGTLDKSGAAGMHGSASGTTSGTTGSTAAGTTGSTASGSAKMEKGKKLHVTSLRMLSSTCS